MRILVTTYHVMEKAHHGDSSYLLKHPLDHASWGNSSTLFDEYGYDTPEEAATAIFKLGESYHNYIIITSIGVREGT